MRIPDYPAANQPLDGTVQLPAWENGNQRQTTVQSIVDAAGAATAVSAAAAANSATLAQAAANSAPLTYSSTAAGIAATTNGQYFYVPSGGLLELYENVSGVAVDQGLSISTPLAQSRTALASIARPPAGQSRFIFLAETGFEGIFVWSGANVSSSVSLDPNKIVYVPPVSDPTGASGAWVRKKDAKFAPIDIGTLVNGDTQFFIDKQTTLIPAPDGNSDFRSFVTTLYVQGSNNAQQIIANQHRVNAWHSAPGNITYVYGYQGFIRVNNNTTLDGTVTQARGFEHHVALEGHGSIGQAYDFFAQGADLSQSSGAGVGTMCGFFSSDQGHATAVTVAALGYDCANMTEGAPLTCAFRSQMSAGVNPGKWAFYAAASAPSAFNGNVRIGDVTNPTNALEVKGYAKLSQDGTYDAANYHELKVNQAGGYAVFVKNSSATPHAIRIKFDGASPANQTQEFIRCEDTTTDRFHVYSDGSVLSKGSILSKSPTAGVGYGTAAGGTVTQATSKSTTVAINKMCGQIVTSNAALAAGANVTFQVNNSGVAATDVIVLNLQSGAATAGSYAFRVRSVAAGSFQVTIENRTGGSLSEALTFNFAVIKAVTA